MIARKSALIVTTQIANGILGYVGLKFIALYMEPWEYGVVGFAYGFVAIFSIIGALGFNQAHIKRVSEGKDLGTCIATFATIKMFLASLLASIVIISIAIWKYVVGRGFESILHEKAVYIMLSYFVLLTLTHSMTLTFNARKEIAKSQLPYVLYMLGRVVATIFVAFYGFGVLALAYTYLFGEIFHFILALLFFKRYPVDKPSFHYFKGYYSFAIHMAIASASWLIMINIDKIIIQLFWSATQVGEYFAVFNLTRFVLMFAAAVGSLLLPTVSEYHAKNNLKEIRKLTLISERYLSMIVFPVIVIMVVLAEPIILILLSNRYIPALPVLQILPFFVLIEVLARPYDSKLQGMNMPKIARNRVLIMMIVNVFLNLVLIPRDIKSLGLSLAGLGAKGAAIATVAAYASGLIYIRLMTRKLTGVKGNYRIVFHAVAAAVTAVILYYLDSIFFIARWYQLLGFAFFGLSIYCGILYIFKEFNKQDFYLFIDSVNPKKMITYINEEIRGK